MFKKFGGGLAVLGAVAFGVYLLFIRPWQLRWGATDEEVARAMPDDDVVKHPTFNATRAVTIQAQPEEIWPWLVQMGVTPRAGWYSYDWIDNLGRPSAERIIPELQHVAVGDLIPYLQIEKCASGSRLSNRISGCSGGTTKAMPPGIGGFTRRMIALPA